MEINIHPRALRRLLIFSLCFLILGGLWAEVVKNVFHIDDPYDLVHFFGLSYERNLSTWFSCLLLFSCSVLLALGALGKRQERAPYIRHWWGLSLAFAYISLDELVCIHENMNGSV